MGGRTRNICWPPILEMTACQEIRRADIKAAINANQEEMKVKMKTAI
jgi:hypothetical protein